MHPQPCVWQISDTIDEALGLIRSIGEIANLFSLFDANADLFLRWKALNEAKRKSEFGPAQVRKQLDKQNLITPMDTERYRQLCETSIHPTPHAEPQTFDRGHPPTMGGYFQSNGLAQAVFELSIQISAIAICTPGVVDLKSTAKGNVKSAGSRLANSIPGVKYEEA